MSKSHNKKELIEKALRDSEERFRTISDNINVGIFRSTPGVKGKFVEVNPALMNILGYDSKEELFMISVSDIYQDPDDRARFNEKIQKEGFVRN